MEENNTSKIIERLKLFFKVKTDTHLASKLDIGQPTISNWRKRDVIDLNLIIRKCPDISMDWLIKGVKSETHLKQQTEINSLRKQNAGLVDDLEKNDTELKKIDVELQKNAGQKVQETESHSNRNEDFPDVQISSEELAQLKAENELLKRLIIQKYTKELYK